MISICLGSGDGTLKSFNLYWVFIATVIISSLNTWSSITLFQSLLSVYSYCNLSRTSLIIVFNDLFQSLLSVYSYCNHISNRSSISLICVNLYWVFIATVMTLQAEGIRKEEGVNLYWVFIATVIKIDLSDKPDKV